MFNEAGAGPPGAGRFMLGGGGGGPLLMLGGGGGGILFMLGGGGGPPPMPGGGGGGAARRLEELEEGIFWERCGAAMLESGAIALKDDVVVAMGEGLWA